MIVFAVFAGMAAAQAQELPARFSVAGVAANDVLNVRAGPSARTEILDRLAPDQAHVEVVRLSGDRKWGMVAIPGANGWVSMRYLAAESLPVDRMPRPMTCMGTEPFWSLGFTGGGATWREPGVEQPITITSESVTPHGWRVALRSASQAGWDVDIRRGECSDGMSDRLFGFTTTISQASAGPIHMGCCTLDGR